MQQIQRHGVHLGRIGGRQILRGEPGKAHLVRKQHPLGLGHGPHIAQGGWALGHRLVELAHHPVLVGSHAQPSGADQAHGGPQAPPHSDIAQLAAQPAPRLGHTTPRRAPPAQQHQRKQGGDLEGAVPQRVFEQAVQPHHSDHAPGQLAHGVGLAPGARPHQPRQHAAAQQQRGGQAQLHRQVQGQVVGVVQQHAKTFFGEQRDVVRVAQLPPPPARPGLERDEVQHVRPQHPACAAGARGVGEPVEQPINAYAADLQQHLRQRPGSQHIQRHAHQNEGDGLACIGAAPQAEQAQHQQPLQGAGARIGGGSGHGQHRQRPPQHHAHAPLGALHPLGPHPQPEQGPHAQRHQRCLLVALAQVAHRLARCGRMNPRQAPGLCAQVLQQPHHATQHRRQQQPPRQRASGTVAQAHALGAGDYRRPLHQPPGGQRQATGPGKHQRPEVGRRRRRDREQEGQRHGQHRQQRVEGRKRHRLGFAQGSEIKRQITRRRRQATTGRRLRQGGDHRGARKALGKKCLWRLSNKRLQLQIQ